MSLSERAGCSYTANRHTRWHQVEPRYLPHVGRDWGPPDTVLVSSPRRKWVQHDPMYGWRTAGPGGWFSAALPAHQSQMKATIRYIQSMSITSYAAISAAPEVAVFSVFNEGAGINVQRGMRDSWGGPRGWGDDKGTSFCGNILGTWMGCGRRRFGDLGPYGPYTPDLPAPATSSQTDYIFLIACGRRARIGRRSTIAQREQLHAPEGLSRLSKMIREREGGKEEGSSSDDGDVFDSEKYVKTGSNMVGQLPTAGMSGWNRKLVSSLPPAVPRIELSCGQVTVPGGGNVRMYFNYASTLPSLLPSLMFRGWESQ
ncbi:hypothetical protein B0H14DRAFT_2574909 [Mycena olivaceomarginata]|nr:hypothetical protein B0H14DRAFT_2574909 [Mycena olivaceomarginata]